MNVKQLSKRLDIEMLEKIYSLPDPRPCEHVFKKELSGHHYKEVCVGCGKNRFDWENKKTKR